MNATLATPIMSEQHKYTKPKYIKHHAAHEYARNAKQSIPISDFMEMFPMHHSSAIGILKRWNRHMPVSKKKVKYVECDANLDKSIDYHDIYRRSVARERLRGNMSDLIGKRIATPAQAREIAAELIRLADKIEGKGDDNKNAAERGRA